MDEKKFTGETLDGLISERKAKILRHSFGLGVPKRTLTDIALDPGLSGSDRVISVEAVRRQEDEGLRQLWAAGHLDDFFDLVKSGRPDEKLTAREQALYDKWHRIPLTPNRQKRRPFVPFNQRKPRNG